MIELSKYDQFSTNPICPSILTHISLSQRPSCQLSTQWLTFSCLFLLPACLTFLIQICHSRLARTSAICFLGRIWLWIPFCYPILKTQFVGCSVLWSDHMLTPVMYLICCWHRLLDSILKSFSILLYYLLQIYSNLIEIFRAIATTWAIHFPNIMELMASRALSANFCWQG